MKCLQKIYRCFTHRWSSPVDRHGVSPTFFCG